MFHLNFLTSGQNRGKTPLQIALGDCRLSCIIEMVNILLEAGCCVHSKDSMGNNCLHTIASRKIHQREDLVLRPIIDTFVGVGCSAAEQNIRCRSVVDCARAFSTVHLRSYIEQKCGLFQSWLSYQSDNAISATLEHISSTQLGVLKSWVRRWVVVTPVHQKGGNGSFELQYLEMVCLFLRDNVMFTLRVQFVRIFVVRGW